ncbi:MAG: GNAT family N-acetyltransferase [Bacteroidetes bacterium]|nr:GNAT family N-acetyltransferase [Fibrella sp.]
MGGKEQIIDYQHFTGFPPEPLLGSLLDLHLSVFAGQTRDEVGTEMAYHVESGPFLMNLALIGDRVIGYKAGYERKPDHFYSWLGCVDPAFRGRGVADMLMRRQHDWCSQQNYHTVRTQTYNRWRGMLILNLKHGFDIIGTQQGAHGLIIVLEKQLPTT